MSCQGHIGVMSGSYGGHFRVISGHVGGHVRVMTRSFPLGIISFVKFTRRLETEGFSVLFEKIFCNYLLQEYYY